MTSGEQARRAQQGRRIRMARVGAGLNQGELAEKVTAETGDFISRTIISGIEAGARDVEYGILLAIAAATGESIDWLTGKRDIPGSYRSIPRKPLMGSHRRLNLTSPGGEVLARAV